MDDRIRQIIADAQLLTLAPEEKAALRMQIQSHLCLNMSAAEKAECRQRLLFAIRKEQPIVLESFIVRFTRIFSLPAIASAFLLIGATGSLAAAAERSQPGDLLYPAKLSVLEPVITAIQFSPEAEAAWALRMMERRLQEGKSENLSEEDEERLAVHLKDCAKTAHEKVAVVEKTETANVIQQKMKLSLEVHERELMRRAERKPSKYLLNAVREIRRERGELAEESSSSSASSVVNALIPVASSVSSDVMTITISPVTSSVASGTSAASTASSVQSASSESIEESSVSSNETQSSKGGTSSELSIPPELPIEEPKLPPIQVPLAPGSTQQLPSLLP